MNKDQLSSHSKLIITENRLRYSFEALHVVEDGHRRKHGFISCGKSFEQLIKDLNNEQNNN